MSPQNKLRNNYLRICIKHHTQCFDVIFDMSGDQKLHCFCDNFDMKMGFISPKKSSHCLGGQSCFCLLKSIKLFFSLKSLQLAVDGQIFEVDSYFSGAVQKRQQGIVAYEHTSYSSNIEALK